MMFWVWITLAFVAGMVIVASGTLYILMRFTTDVLNDAAKCKAGIWEIDPLTGEKEFKWINSETKQPVRTFRNL